tara:strand:- start:17 stop:205 length:189 start_codon:yes stop_codon:yes gene_type:complete
MKVKSEKEMWEEERRLALMETESLPKWEKTTSALEKKLTRKQKVEHGRFNRFFRFFKKDPTA